MAIICFLTILTNVNGVVKANQIFTPILIIFIVIIGIINLDSINIKDTLEKVLQINPDGWLLSSILYCSYNSILLIPVIITLRKYLKNEKDILIITVLSCVVIFILSITIYLLLSRINIDIGNLEMPAVYVVSTFYSQFKLIYAIIILFAIYTTAVTIGVSLLENITQNKKSYIFFNLLICISGVIVSGIGFSNLVELLYPIFGVLGLIQIFMICKAR